MVWPSSRCLRWGYVCSYCGSNRDTGKRLFIVNAPGGLGYDHSTATNHSSSSSSSSSSADYLTLKRELHECNCQKENLLLQIQDLRESNKKYREHVDQRESSRRQEAHRLEKAHSSRLSDRDRLVNSLQGVLDDHERTIQQLEERLHGHPVPQTTTASSPISPVPSPTSSPFARSASLSSSSNSSCLSISTDTSGVGSEASHTSRGSGASRLIADIRTLHEEKSRLVADLAEAQGKLSVCQLEHMPKIAALQRSLAERETGASHLQDNLTPQADNGDLNSCITDTEKQLKKVLAENECLEAEVASLQRFYTRNPSPSFVPQAETLRQLEEENSELRSRLLQQTGGEAEDGEQGDNQHAQSQFSPLLLHNRLPSTKDQHDHSTDQWSEEGGRLTVGSALSGRRGPAHQRSPQQLQELRAKWSSLHAKDPDMITKIVEIEIESEDLKIQMADLGHHLEQWQRRCAASDSMVADLQKQIQHVSDKLKQEEEDKHLLKTCLGEELEKERQSKELALSDVRRDMQHQMYDLKASNQQMRLRTSQLRVSFDSLKQAYILLATQTRQFPQMVTVTVKDLQQQMMSAVHHVTEENKDLVRKYHKEMRLRKKYHNELVELKGNIRVFCRVRPPIKEDGTGTQADVIVTYDPDDLGLIYVSNKGRIQTFEFDRVFSASSTQTEVFEEVRALVTSCIDGFNVCIFAYGQTGSGKTFTMEGNVANPGINQRALLELFSETADKGEDWTFTIEVGVLEIYNETIRDLLNSDSGNKLEVKMRGEGGGYHVPGLLTKVVTSLQEVNQVFAEGRRNRATATTNMNEHSSRSHCLLCVTVTGVNRTTNSRSFGRLNLVDLAGSERVSKSGADGTRLKEAQNINKSLACLGDVIHALRVKQSHIPFRNSKLTYLLQDSLGGDSKTLMIVQAAPVEKNVSETTCSLSFGQRVRTVELGAATRKIDSGGDSEVKSPKSPTSPISSSTSSPSVKSRTLTPRSSPFSPAHSRLSLTPSKSSPTFSARSPRQTPRK
ncbi:hypothetical protein ACOMHN_001003 [Nucella lapillus]